MSNYCNFICDFPNRCDELLQKLEADARFRNRDVTLMLCLANPAIVIPLERLKNEHPSQDSSKFARAKAELDGLFKEKFLGSRLQEASSTAWSFDELSDASGDPDSWPEMNAPKALGNDKKVKAVLEHIRNALAHGNIFTCGNPIERIILLSQRARDVPKFNYLAVSPGDFRKFLENWLTFLRQLDLSNDLYLEEAAA